MEEEGWSFNDPLKINLSRQTRKLLCLLPPGSTRSVAIQNAPSRAVLLNSLSAVLVLPQYTHVVATLFRPLLVELSARWLHQDGDDLQKLEALCFLLEFHPELYPVLSALLKKRGLERGPLHPYLSAQPVAEIDSRPVQRTLLAYYRLLRANRTLPGALGWSLTPLSQLIIAHPDKGVRLLAIKCYALQAGMLEGERVKLERENVGDVRDTDCPVLFEANPDGTAREVDGWVLPTLEAERIVHARDELLEVQDYYMMDENDSCEPIHPAELSPLVVNVHGILMLRSSIPDIVRSPLIDTPTAVQSLRDIALYLSTALPILLTSAPSSGKSLLISHLAQTLFPDARNLVVTIHLADTSLDPRALLGSYVSSPVRPGTFEWKEGVLVRAMREGKWVVLEDIDRATMEVLGIIKPLVESLGADNWIGGRARLEVPSRGTVEAKDTFAVFATRSIQPSRKGGFPTPTFYGAHKFYEVTVASPTASDLRMIINTKFPYLAGAPAQGLINLWRGVRALGNPAATRDIGLRELERFCTRVNSLLPSNFQSMDIDEDNVRPVDLSQIFTNPTMREDIFLEARDVFFGAGATTTAGRAHLLAIAGVVAGHLGLSDERKDWIMHNRTPEFDVEKDVNGRITAVRVGRMRLPARTAKMEVAPVVARPFAMHRPAISLMARLATAISLAEPILLTGETGTGKTSVVTHLASLLHRPLISLNLSNQTESSDILGGFKPIDARVPGAELQQRFLDLFGGTFSTKKNAHFAESVRKAVQERKWKRVAGLWSEATKMAKGRIQARQAQEDTKELEGGTPRKRRKVEGSSLKVSMEQWDDFERDIQAFEVQHVQGKSKFAFAFVEGPLIKALRNGDWILLDEVNLATPETLESISSLLHSPTASITLTEQGSLEPIPRHPDFRLFACMNPATDVGKKDLPPNIRSRFTEIDVPSPDADKETLLAIVAQYIGACAVGDKGAIMDVAEFYTAVKRLADERQIADGANHRPHFSMRTLARALTFAADMATSYSLRRALWEGCLMAFTMVLDGPSATAVTALAQKHILAGVRNPRSLLTKEPLPPGDSSAFVKFGPFYLGRGPLPEDPSEDYIMTPSVETKLIDLARIIAAKRFPILIEGPTSSGKTSSIEYLAKRTGHRFVRINNHEHTDIQEYIGTYVSDPVTGKLVFKEGLLVRALRRGDWIVLDELNLAPTDVLEALNRLLDDNRELVIPETQEVVRPHPNFMLFATQNPPGLYAGRKVLSRAFRNRFLEVHFEDVPQAELETILCQRCRIAPSYGQRIVSVFRELQKRRQSSRVFESKQGFATLRDLFRWAGRDAISYEELAANGYMLLAERARREDDKIVVKEVIESIMKVRVDEASLYDMKNPKYKPTSFLGCPLPSSSQVVWTSAMQRLFVLTARALRFNEPVLLVGETGCGKTSACQLYAEVLNRMLRAVNCHQNTETADLIGGLRPIRNRAAVEAETFREATTALSQFGTTGIAEDAASLTTAIDGVLQSGSVSAPQRTALYDIRARLQRLSAMFEWRDGPLVEAMKQGDIFLLDEISLADDSVLERLNSVLEPGRTIVLAERGGNDDEIPVIKAGGEFKFVATMNPGGDYGKKELSPALRNRFTEIWVPSITDRSDLECIVDTLWQHQSLGGFTKPLLDFVEWLCSAVGDRAFANLRDILAWVSFSNAAVSGNQDTMPISTIFHHAAEMTFLDGLGSMPQVSAYSKQALRRLKLEASAKLHELVPVPSSSTARQALSYNPEGVHLGPFSIPRGPYEPASQVFSLEAPTTRDNVLRVVRACQLQKPIMLEGSPGVGKTSLVAALANMCGYHLSRINLSDQTDLVDLFGSDLPMEGGEPGQFAWKDAEFLRALQEGHWVLLDEMNLAPQSVLEGLNAVLDHRGTVYIPELGRSFVRHPSFRIFAAQNPLHQGGGRKGLPKSFLNRFTKVYVQEMSPADLLLICQNLFPNYPAELLEKMIEYMSVLNEETMVKRSFAREGAPWEFNLRDVIRWATLLCDFTPPPHPSRYLPSVILQRFRTTEDRDRAHKLFTDIFGPHELDRPVHIVTPSHIQIGHHRSRRSGRLSSCRSGRIFQESLPALESLGACIAQGWLTILTGPKNSGKTTLVRTVANMFGKTLHEVPVNNATDATDILGSFEETDPGYRVVAIAQKVLSLLADVSCTDSGPLLHHVTDYATLLRNLPDKVSSATMVTVVDALSRVLVQLQNLPQPYHTRYLIAQDEIRQLVEQGQHTGHLEWVDGPLVRAIKNGHWLLLDGANLCNASVLDRLNSLCEMGGSLTLNERGAVDGEVQVLRPHPDFRLFMCSDGQYGELSRAMRNRGVEISLSVTLDSEDLRRTLDQIRCSPRLHVSPPDYESPITIFSRIRRGVCDPPTSLHSSSQAAERLLGDESLNSLAADMIPTLATSTGVVSSTRAALYFAAENVVPDGLAYLSRLLPHCDNSPTPAFYSTLRSFLGMIECSDVYRTIVQIRKNVNRPSQIPCDVLLAQPLYSNANASSETPSEEDVNATTLPLRYLRLLTAVGNEYGHCVNDRNRNAPKHSRAVDQARPEDRAIASAEALIEAIKTASTSVLSHPDFASGGADVDVTLQVVTFGRYLQEAIGSGATFDFSLAFAVVGWIDQTIVGRSVASATFSGVSVALTSLKNIVSLSKGLGLIDIWRALWPGAPVHTHEDKIAELDRIDRHLVSATHDLRLRARILDLLAVWGLPDVTNIEHERMLVELGALVQKRSSELNVPDDPLPSQTGLVQMCARLQALHAASPNTSVPKNILQDIIDLGLSDIRSSLPDLVPYKQLLWACDAAQPIAPLYVQLLRSWLARIWSALPVAELNGPSALCHPVELSDTVIACDETVRPLSGLIEYHSELNRRLVMASGKLTSRSSRWSQLLGILIHTALLLISSVVSTERDTADLHRAPPSVSGVIAALDKLQDEKISALYRRHLRAPLQTLSAVSCEHSYSALGRGWIGLSRLLLELYVPTVPIDPAAVQRCSQKLWADQFDDLQAELAFQRHYERRTGGRRDNLVTRFLSAALQEVDQHSCEGSRAPSRRSDTIKLHAYWSEVTQFLEQAASSPKVDAIIKALESGDASALLREEMVQESVAAFSQRLDTVYSEFADINGPLQVAFLQQRLGLRFIADAAATSRSDNSEGLHVAQALVTFPSVRGAELLRTTSQSSTTSFSIVIAKLESAASDVASGADIRTFLPQVEAIYEQALGLWLIDKARAEEEEREAQSLYRSKTESNAPATEVELEEQDFLALFPEYGDLLDPDATPSTRPHHKPAALVDPANVKRLSLLHQFLFGTERIFTYLETLVGVEDLRRLLVHDTLLSDALRLPESLDQLSRPYQISLLASRLSRLRGFTTAGLRPYNFYSDSSVVEVNKGLEVLRQMVGRLIVLMKEWPEQMVLQHLKARCDALLDLDIFSPVAKVLSAVEQLLLQMEDWEMYANRENSLKAYQHDLAALVVSWRRLELTSWQGLLRTQAQEFAEGASDYWFQLYEATVRGVASAVQEEELGEEGALANYLEGLVPLLDTFMGSTPLGQYASRLGYLQAFETYCFNYGAFHRGNISIAFQRVHRVLRFTRTYYSQFATRVAESLTTQQEVLEKEIRGFIKLASWKDINVHALKQSAQRTHRQLYKCVRKFREILRQPVASLLVPAGAGAEETTATADIIQLRLAESIPTFPPFTSPAVRPNHLSNLERTFKNYRLAIQGRIGDLIGSLSSTEVEDLSGEIIVTLQSLSSASAPASVTGEQRDKALKALLVRKRKAWSDLLKELKRVGLATSVKPEILQQQSSARWLREQPVVSQTEVTLGPFDRSETYLLRLSKLLPDLRAAIGDHNPDIGTRDLQRGISLVESAFALAVETRASFVDATEQYTQLLDVTNRVRVITQHPRIVASGSEVHARAICMKEDLGRLINALEETHAIWKQYLDELPDTEALVPAIDELQSAIASSKALFHRVAAVTKVIKLTPVPALLEDEASVFHETLDHIRTVAQLLLKWADGPNVVALFANPLHEWLEARESFSLSQFEHTPRDSPDSTGRLIDRLLLCAQGILAIPSPPINESPELYATQDRFLRDYSHRILQVTRALKVDEVNTLLASAVSDAIHAPSEQLVTRLTRILPFLDAYLELARAQLTNHCGWTKALFKLDYIVCTVMRTVAQNGFCKPQDAGEGEAGDGEAQDAGGVGLGEGTGKENVSKEIEDESQVEGLQGEAGEDEDVERAEEGNALEMSEDIGGKMQDVEEAEGDDDKEEDDGESEDDEPEEQLGDLDAADPSAVDEKLWGDESGPDDAKEDGGKSAEDHSTQKDNKSETVAKEDEGRKESKEKQKEQAPKESLEGQEGDEPIPEDAVPEEAGEDGEQDQQEGGSLDDFVPEANTLDLPDDLDFGDKEGKEPELDDDIDMGDEEGEDEDNSPEENKPGEGMDEDAEEDDTMDVEDNPQAIPEDATQPENNIEDIVDGVVAQPDLHAGAGQDSGEAGDQAMADANQGEGGNGPSSSGEVGGLEETEERDGSTQDVASPEDRPQERATETSPSATEKAENSQDVSGSARARQGAAPSQAKSQPLQNNPLRSLGDALREISQRMDEILDSEGPQERHEQMDTSGAPQLEYLRQDEDQDAEEMQALGPAQQEDVAKLNDLKFLDEETKPTEAMQPMGEDAPEAPPEPSSRAPQSALHAEPTSHSMEGDMKSALTQTDVRSQQPVQPAANTSDQHLSDSLVPAEDGDHDPQHDVELALRHWQAEGQPESQAEDMWRKYESLTHDLSYALCEQLRLILEPTQATRLKGDYRTGKRLNMKKIIPYIASEFTKDKIWLRRTRPSQREYQVLIALDDSRSMAESHSVHLAFQTLALVAKALGRLEVGDVAIAKFGEAVDVLHSFDGGPFTDQAGTRVMGAFHFDQKATQVLSLVETSLRLLEQARERRAVGSSSAADLWQLEILISDGLCQDHERLRTVLRRAEEQRVMIVFIILDSLHSKGATGSGANESSILSMNQVGYKMVDGRMDLQVERYLDTFPFEYYVVLRNVEALPDVLSGTLKQFFERVAEA